MKKSTVLMIAMTFMMTSCGTIAQLASSGNGQKFQDGIYSNAPVFMSKEERDESKAETKALIEKTKESPAYTYSNNNEALTIRPSIEQPATINVTVIDNPYDWHNLINPWSYYTPYSIGSSWWWSRHYDPWYWTMSYHHYGWHSPFRYGRWHYGSAWYNPWHYNSWYSPWYNNSWYYTWYYDSFWYNPFYFDSWYYGGAYYPHYGWYGGWDPYWHYHRPGFPAYGPGHMSPHKDHYYTPRRETEIKAPDTPTNRTTVVRRGTGTSSSTSRGTVGQSSSNRRPTKTTGSNRNENVSPSNRPAGSTTGRQPASSSDRQNNTVNYRRPSVSSGNTDSQNREAVSRGQSSGSDRGTTVPRSSSTYDRGSSSSYDRGSSSSSYNRSYSTPSRSSGFGGGGSYNPGGSSSGGSYNRGGSSGGGRR